MIAVYRSRKVYLHCPAATHPPPTPPPAVTATSATPNGPLQGDAGNNAMFFIPYGSARKDGKLRAMSSEQAAGVAATPDKK